MKSEKGRMLETDRLDELLEVPPPAQPVVVVEYRSRGVPSWVFFPLIFVVPTAALVVYHRMVVERYRVQAAQANSLLEREISDERAQHASGEKRSAADNDLTGAAAAAGRSARSRDRLCS